jgi:hypothetical protein
MLSLGSSMLILLLSGQAAAVIGFPLLLGQVHLYILSPFARITPESRYEKKELLDQPAIVLFGLLEKLTPLP